MGISGDEKVAVDGATYIYISRGVKDEIEEEGESCLALDLLHFQCVLHAVVGTCLNMTQVGTK